jgi:hypothetical protein
VEKFRHLNFWKEAIKTLKNMYFVDKGGKKNDTPKFKELDCYTRRIFGFE